MHSWSNFSFFFFSTDPFVPAETPSSFPCQALRIYKFRKYRTVCRGTVFIAHIYDGIYNKMCRELPSLHIIYGIYIMSRWDKRLFLGLLKNTLCGDNHVPSMAIKICLSSYCLSLLCPKLSFRLFRSLNEHSPHRHCWAHTHLAI